MKSIKVKDFLQYSFIHVLLKLSIAIENSNYEYANNNKSITNFVATYSFSIDI